MAADFRQLLEDGDFKGLRRAWAEVMPNHPRPKTNADAETTMHMARTVSASVSLPKRAYSHAWLLERGLPSQLPDHLKPKAEQIHPVVKGAVGVSVNFRSEVLRPAAVEVQSAMNAAIEECFADGVTDPEKIKVRMMQAKDKAMRALFG